MSVPVASTDAPLSTADLAGLTAPRVSTELPRPDRPQRDRARRARHQSLADPGIPVGRRTRLGAVIEDVDGNHFLDFNAGIAVNAAGHAHPVVNAAVHAQVDACSTTAPPTSTTRSTPSCASGWQRRRRCRARGRSSPTPAPRQSRGAIKLARHHTRRPNVIAFYRAFHGRSLGSLSLTSSKAKYRSGFGIVTPGSYHVPLRSPTTARSPAPSIEGVLFERMTEPGDVAAIFVEPIQGAGGYVAPPPAGWLGAEPREPRDSGTGSCSWTRSGGSLPVACGPAEHDEVVPDIITAGKGLASGFPLCLRIHRP